MKVSFFVRPNPWLALLMLLGSKSSFQVTPVVVIKLLGGTSL